MLLRELLFHNAFQLQFLSQIICGDSRCSTTDQRVLSVEVFRNLFKRCILGLNVILPNNDKFNP